MQYHKLFSRYSRYRTSCNETALSSSFIAACKLSSRTKLQQRKKSAVSLHVEYEVNCRYRDYLNKTSMVLHIARVLRKIPAENTPKCFYVFDLRRLKRTNVANSFFLCHLKNWKNNLQFFFYGNF